jgi:hypothetical protein
MRYFKQNDHYISLNSKKIQTRCRGTNLLITDFVSLQDLPEISFVEIVSNVCASNWW